MFILQEIEKDDNTRKVFAEFLNSQDIRGNDASFFAYQKNLSLNESKGKLKILADWYLFCFF